MSISKSQLHRQLGSGSIKSGKKILTNHANTCNIGSTWLRLVVTKNMVTSMFKNVKSATVLLMS